MFITWISICIYVLCQPCPSADCACTIPQEFRNTAWLDSVRAEVTFTTWAMKGWSFTVQSQTVEQWEIVDNSKFESDGFLAFRSVDTFSVDNVTYYSYLCMKMSKVTDTSYRYYVLHDKEPLATMETVLVKDHDDLTEFDEICDVNFQYEEGVYSLLMKKDTDSSIQCPTPILGRFEYTIHETDGTTVCPGVATVWDGCSSKETLSFNLTSCPYKVAYSAGGNLRCISSSTSGDYTYIYVYNTDKTVDQNETFRFSCIVTEQSGRRLTIVPHTCHSDQTPYKLPKADDGTVVGQKIINHEYSLCRITATNSAAQKSPFTAPVIVGIGLGAGALICIIAVTLFCYFKMSYSRM